nr:MAG TPA: hypothetical protein [Caudoviricetes sp.]
MDDSYLLCNDSKYLAECKAKIEKKLKDIGLALN